MATSSKRLVMVRTLSKGCPVGEGQTRLVFRERSTGTWSRPTYLTRCSTAQLGTPFVTIDYQTHDIAVVWYQIETVGAQPKAEFRMRTRAGRRWTKNLRLAKGPNVGQPVRLVAALRAKRVWLMYPNDKTSSEGNVPLRLNAYNMKNGKRLTTNLIVGTGDFNTDTQFGTLALHAGRSGLLAQWSLTDRSGVTHWYMGDTKSISGKISKTMRLSYRGEQEGIQGYEPYTTRRSGEDGEAYLFASTDDDEGNTTLSALRWSFDEHKFEPAVEEQLALATVRNTGAPSLISGGADTDGRVLIAYLDIPPDHDCVVTESNALCVRSTAPDLGIPLIRVLRAEPDGSETEVSDIYFPFGNDDASKGSDVISWWQPGSGLNAITGAFGGPRLFYHSGYQVLRPSGGETADKWVGVLTDQIINFDEPDKDPAPSTPSGS